MTFDDKSNNVIPSVSVLVESKSSGGYLNQGPKEIADMCQTGIIITVGLVMTDLVVLFMLFGLWDPIYFIDGNSKVHTQLKYDIWKICVEAKYDHGCAKFNDPLLNGTGAKAFETRATVTMACLFVTLGCAAVIILLGFLACCRVLSLESGVPYVVVLVFSCLVFAFALVTCCVPTSEFTTNEKQFNDLNTRKDSFYGKVLQQFGDHFGSRSSKEIDRDLKSEELELKFGWVLGVIWAAPCFALAALLFFALSRLCVGRAKMKSSA